MKMLQKICFVLLLGTFSSVYGGNCGDDCRVRAEQGDAEAQFNLGLKYSNGKGVPQDSKEAVKWYRLAAEQGNKNTQNKLGMMYRYGWGVSRDAEEAVKWFRQSAEQGDKHAQSNLGRMYRYGWGVSRDYNLNQ